MTMPNFLICGAGKCGSTTLWAVLRQHPHVFMPFDKEPKFFAAQNTTPRGNHALGLAWYESLFATVKEFHDEICELETMLDWDLTARKSQERNES